MNLLTITLLAATLLLQLQPILAQDPCDSTCNPLIYAAIELESSPPLTRDRKGMGPVVLPEHGISENSMEHFGVRPIELISRTDPHWNMEGDRQSLVLCVPVFQPVPHRRTAGISEYAYAT
ncbi:hypothetical protein B0H13DRAFT_1877711 [Mycena leptocephala]|nr:hypothetical protein B0H13DRAFT_1877711 [Mycena leptocephala]